MSVIADDVRPGVYLDSVALMRVAQTIRALDGVEDAGLMIGTPANLAILSSAGLLAASGAAAGAADLILAVRARDPASAEAALSEARRAIDAPAVRSGGPAHDWRPRSIRAAVAGQPDANLALISVPGDFAAVEAGKALSAGLDVMIFSDNVALADEAALKRRAQTLGRLLMGPDCGTSIISGVPIGFANIVPRGPIGLVGASGTGMQEISCLIARAGHGISHAIGTGGRDLSAEIGGLTTLAAIALLEADAATRHIVVVSKPPAPGVAVRILERLGQSTKSVTVCFIGAEQLSMPANARQAMTLTEAAHFAIAAVGSPFDATAAALPVPNGHPRGPWIAGLYAGGTLCSEAQVVLQRCGLQVGSNVPIPGNATVSAQGLGRGHMLLDLGADEFTRGRPHPMIEPAVRDQALQSALAQRAVGVILFDVVLGTGGHSDPAGHVARLVADATDRPFLIASVTGTASDAPTYRQQVDRLTEAGVTVAQSNAAAAAMAAAIAARPPA